MIQDTYTVVLTEEQKQLLLMAVEKFSQLHLGYTLDDHEAAKKLLPRLAVIHKHGTNDLTK